MSTNVMDLASYRATRDRSITEATFQAQVLELAKRCGWLTYHDFDSRRSSPGFPDLVLVHPIKHRCIFAELKTIRGKARREQTVWLTALGHCDGVETYLWRPNTWNDIVAVLTGSSQGNSAS